MQGDLNHSIVNTIITFVVINVALLLGLYASIKKIVIQPITDVIVGLHDISEGEGDLTKRLKRKKDDEVGKLSDCFNVFYMKHHSPNKRSSPLTRPFLAMFLHK